MRFAWLFFLGPAALAQPSIQPYKDCSDKSCRVSQAIKITEAYLEADDLESAQFWLNAARKENPPGENAEAYLIHSLQSEIFYYIGLYEFGAYEAQKGVKCAEKLRDSLFLADGYFFEGINEFEMGNDKEALSGLYRAGKVYPSRSRKLPRTIITQAHIYNNIAQVKLKRKEVDSAIYYNRKAYQLARKHQYLRVISNAEQIFGTIFLEHRQRDSARIYLERSIASAVKNKFYDIGLLGHGYLMEYYSASDKMDSLYARGQQLMANHNVNALYKKYFLEKALELYRETGNRERIVSLQQQLLTMQRETDTQKNYYVRHIIDQYMQSENKLLTSQINDLNQEKNITALQLIAAMLGIAILLAAIVIIRRKNKLQQLLLDQKNEISKDLHDDIGSELSSILINANLLDQNCDTNDRQKLLLGKITQTSTEISERLNTFIWSLNTENNNVAHFCEYVHQYGSRLFEASGTDFQYSVNIEGTEDRQLNGYFRKNLFFCIKETLNNVMKHSGATNINLVIESDRKNLEITIADNGSGMRKENALGNGLKNVRKRIEALHGKVKYENGQGLEVFFSVPFPAQ